MLHLKRALVILVAAAALVVVASYAWACCFSTWAAYDDQGYFQMAVQFVRDGARPYDDFPFIHGPSYFLFRSLLHDAARIPLTTDGIRLVTLGVWLATTLGLATWAWLESPPSTRGPAAIATILLVGLFLNALAYEPGHSHELYLLVLSIWLAGWRWIARGPGTRRWIVTGFAAGLVSAAKINLGLFFGAAVATAALERCDGPRFLRPSAVALLAAAPFLLAREHLGEPWVAALAVTIAASVLHLGIGPRPRAELPSRAALWIWGALTLGALAALAAMILYALALGSSPARLASSVVLDPLRFPSQFLRMGAVDRLPLAATLAGLAFALGLRSARGAWVRPVDLAVTCAARAGLLLALADAVAMAPAYWEWATALLPLAIRPLSTAGRPAPTPWTWRALAWIHVVGLLQLYPVAGTKAQVAAVAAIPLACVTAADAVVRLAEGLPWRRALPAAVLLLWIALALPFRSALRWERILSAHYAHLEPLGQPGAERTRTEPGTAARMAWVTTQMRANGTSWVSTASSNSLLAWSGRRPAHPILVLHTWDTISAAEEVRLLDAMDREADPWVVDIPSRFAGGAHPARPFFERLERDFDIVARLGEFRLLARPEGPAVRLRDCAWRSRADRVATLSGEAVRAALQDEGVLFEVALPPALAGQVIHAVTLATETFTGFVRRSDAHERRRRVVLFTTDGRALVGDGATGDWAVDVVPERCVLAVLGSPPAMLGLPFQVGLWSADGTLVARLPVVRARNLRGG